MEHEPPLTNSTAAAPEGTLLLARLRGLENELSTRREQQRRTQERIAQELEVQQVELEMQTRALEETQAMLEDSRGRYADLYYHAPTSYATVSSSGRLVDANAVFCEHLNLPRERIVGLGLVVFLAPQSRAVFERCLLECFVDGKEVSAQLLLQAADSAVASSVHASLQRAHGRWGPSDNVQVSLTKVGKRDQRDAQLNFLLDSSEILCQTLEPDLVSLRVAQLAVPFFGDAASYSTPAASERISVALGPPMAQRHRSQIEAFDRQAQGAPLLRRVHEVRKLLLVNCSDTERAELLLGPDLASSELVRSLRSVAALPVLSRGKVVGTLLLFQHKKSPVRTYVPTFCEDFARRAGLAVDNAGLYQRTREESAARRNLLAFVSHDLRNPLSVILLKAEHLMCAADKVDADGANKVERSAKVVVQCAHRMNELIGDLLDATSLESGTFRVCRGVESLTAILEEALENAQASTVAKELVLSADVVADMDVLCDHRRTLQVLANLLSNAIKFSERRGTITVRVEPEGSFAHVSVIDNGVGMSADSCGRVFGQFWQAELTAYLGHGLGLSISRGIVEACGGKIWAQSVEGEGSTFHFTLPRAAAKLAAASQKPNQTGEAGAPPSH